MSRSPGPLKAQNVTWLWAVVGLDAIVLLALAFPSIFGHTNIKEYAWIRAGAAVVAPVVVLLLTSLLSSDVKAVLVFWRFRDTFPGHRAFSVHAVKDPRIDIEALRKNVGKLPEVPRDQNATWYRLFKKVEGEVTVAQAHRHYLLFRDLATLSLLLAPFATLTLYILDVAPAAVGFAAVLFIGQSLAAAVAARNNGVRLVTNVLALHAVKRRT